MCIRVSSRGIGSDWGLKCYVCGKIQDLSSNISIFIGTKEEGEETVKMFKDLAFLDYRPHEPNWIQVKVGACKDHLSNLQALDIKLRNGFGLITKLIIEESKKIEQADVPEPRIKAARPGNP